MQFLLGSNTAQVLKFGVVGVVNTVVTLATIYVLYVFFDVPYLAANAVGYVLGFINSFVLNKVWTFRSKGKVLAESILFIAVFLVCYLLQLAALGVLTDWFRVNLAIAQILAFAVYTGFNFLGNKLVTFRAGARGHEQEKGKAT